MRVKETCKVLESKERKAQKSLKRSNGMCLENKKEQRSKQSREDSKSQQEQKFKIKAENKTKRQPPWKGLLLISTLWCHNIILISMADHTVKYYSNPA